jgi:FMN reductase
MSDDSKFMAINGSPSGTSKTHAVAALGVELMGGGKLIDLGDLDAAALLGRQSDPELTAILDEIPTTKILLLVTPVYRATYSGLLKVLLDQLPQGALKQVVCVLAATGGSPHHYLSIDTGLRPVVASLLGTSVPTSVYLTGEDFDDNTALESARKLLGAAVDEARHLARIPID